MTGGELERIADARVAALEAELLEEVGEEETARALTRAGVRGAVDAFGPIGGIAAVRAATDEIEVALKGALQ